MTVDEFERILTAACQMHIINMAGSGVPSDLYVSLRGVMKIVHSQLHTEDREKWAWDDKAAWFVKRPECP